MAYTLSRHIKKLMSKLLSENRISLVNLSFLTEAMSNDHKTILKFIDIFLDQFPEDMNGVSDAVHSHNISAVKQAAHRMRSTAMVMGIERIEKILLEMEMHADAETFMPDITALHIQLKEMFPLVITDMYRLKLKYS